MTKLVGSYQEGTVTLGRTIYSLTEEQLIEAVKGFLIKQGVLTTGGVTISVREPRNSRLDEDSGVTVYVQDPQPKETP